MTQALHGGIEKRYYAFSSQRVLRQGGALELNDSSLLLLKIKGEDEKSQYQQLCCCCAGVACVHGASNEWLLFGAVRA